MFYDSALYNNLREVDRASDHFEARDDPDSVIRSLEALFRKHSVTDTLGVALLHRHFELKPDEVVVDLRGIATPWHISSLKNSNYQGIGAVLPLSLMLIEGQPRAYEFYFDMDSSRSPVEIPKDFISEYEAILDTHGLKETLGLRVLRTTDDRPGGSTMEYSERYATFTIPMGEKKQSDYTNNGKVRVIKTTWNFTGHSDGNGGSCSHYCWHCGQHCGHCGAHQYCGCH